MSTTGKVYLIPSLLADDGQAAIPDYILDAIKDCQVFFVENERTARRYLKKIWREIAIDDYKWYDVSDSSKMSAILRTGKNIGIISEAGCPGIADPGQALIEMAHQMHAEVKPLVGPNSIVLALMGSGMNGQRFQFLGYLPVKEPERDKMIRELEAESKKKNCTQVFIETPYRNNPLFHALLKVCKPSTQLCIAANLTSANEFIKTKSILEWKKEIPELHKQPVIYCLLAR